MSQHLGGQMYRRMNKQDLNAKHLSVKAGLNSTAAASCFLGIGISPIQSSTYKFETLPARGKIPPYFLPSIQRPGLD